MKMFDIVVVGGNLSGAIATIKASEMGAEVAIVERNSEPFNPAHCAEAIPDVTAEFLNLDRMDCHMNEIKKFEVEIESKKYTFKIYHKGFVVDRNCIERKLLEIAGKKAELIIGNGMVDFEPPNRIYLKNGDIIEGKVIIDASGIGCVIGRRIGMDTKLKAQDVGICIQSRVSSNFDSRVIKMKFHLPFAPFGYSWIFPHSDELANIGIGMIGGQRVNLQKLLDEYISFSTDGKYEVISTFKSCVPLARPMEKVVKNNVMIVGDAARLAMPLLGGGIGNAVFSGNLAGRIAAEYIEGKSRLEKYQDEMMEKIQMLTRNYNYKIKMMVNEEKFIKTLKKNVRIAHLVHSIFPRLTEDKFFLKIYH
jgi:digeranylgeranylglycerophospholipid reductase